MKEETLIILRKTIGWILLSGIFPIAFYIAHMCNNHDRLTHPWYYPILAGYALDAVILVIIGLFALIVSLILGD